MEFSRTRVVVSGCLLMLAIAASNSAKAVTTTSGAGLAVSIIDRSANFDTITSDGMLLSSYSEDMLNISTPGTSDVGFTAFTSGMGTTTGFYYAGGNKEYITITTSDSVDMFGLELRLGHGFTGTLDASVVWETYSNNILTGSGQFDTTRGTIIGWSDTVGFDELRVGASVLGYASFGEDQAIAIDDLNVQITTVPLPAAIWLFGSGLLAMLGITRRRHLP